MLRCSALTVAIIAVLQCWSTKCSPANLVGNFLSLPSFVAIAVGQHMLGNICWDVVSLVILHLLQLRHDTIAWALCFCGNYGMWFKRR